AFPVAQSTKFTNHPALLGSRNHLPSSPQTKRRRKRGEWKPGDVLLLMTDALAQWFLAQVEGGHRPWGALLRRDTVELTAFLDELRDRKELRNDDVTLVVVGNKP